MKRIVEVEETIKVRHRLHVYYDNEQYLKDALDNVVGCNLGNYMEKFTNYGNWIEDVDENYSKEIVAVKHYDDYAED